MLLAYLANNPALILDPQLLADLGLLRLNMTQEACKAQQVWMYKGTVVAFWNVSTWPGFELVAEVSLVVWGILLGVVSWPFTGLVFGVQ